MWLNALVKYKGKRQLTLWSLPVEKKSERTWIVRIKGKKFTTKQLGGNNKLGSKQVAKPELKCKS